jgi:hypothetical protein
MSGRSTGTRTSAPAETTVDGPDADDPDADGTADRTGDGTADGGTDDSEPDGTGTPADGSVAVADREFGPAGWALVGAIAVAFLLVPGVILALPAIGGPDPGVFGLPWRDTFLVLPLVPAFALAAMAVWVAVRATGPPER